MTSKLPPSIPEGRSIMKDRIALFDIEAMAKAPSLEALKVTLQNTLGNLTQIDEVVILKKLQAIAQGLQKNPHDGELLGEMNEALIKAEHKNSIKTGRHAWSSLYYQDDKSFFSTRQELINEYQAKTPSELLVIDTALVAYYRYIRATKLVNSCLEEIHDDKEENQLWTNTMKELNKAMNSAHQQMIMAFTFLKESRRQPIQVKVHTDKAYFAHNQQINEDKPPNDFGNTYGKSLR